MELGRVVAKVAADESAAARDDDVMGMEVLGISTTSLQLSPHKTPEHHGNSPQRSLEQ